MQACSGGGDGGFGDSCILLTLCLAPAPCAPPSPPIPSIPTPPPGPQLRCIDYVGTPTLTQAVINDVGNQGLSIDATCWDNNIYGFDEGSSVSAIAKNSYTNNGEHSTGRRSAAQRGCTAQHSADKDGGWGSQQGSVAD